ncbi:DegT/DnrJ/EryC1/StrS family aminotransferase [Candidatus Woesearchaeota archaeon]|nr:DegT/DnrJ/EryC1/StrS family aminotransferase [Candidatus Woesearchaeota archaeon]
MDTEYIPYGKQAIAADDIRAVATVLESDWITTGPKVKEFEEAVARYCNATYGIAVSSGTAALDMAIQALGLAPGSEIITTPFTFIATINSILFNNCIPVLADIDSETYNINPASVRKKITPKTKALLYVNYAGQPCNIEELQKIAQEHRLFLIEDSAQALGAEYNDQKIGSFADMTVLSFHPVKHITTGEGGMVLTNNKEFDHTLRLLRNHGINKEVQERFGPQAEWSYDVLHLARNYRLTDFQSALGLSQLAKLDGFIQQRETIAWRYTAALQGHPHLRVPIVREKVRHAWHLYPILIGNYERDLFFKKMRENGIGVNVHHIPAYEFTYHKRFGWKAEDYPITHRTFKSIISLPIYPSLSTKQQEFIIQTVKRILHDA